MTPPGLSPKQERFLVALLQCPTVHGAARAVGVSEKTGWFWLRQDAFKRAYTTARHDALRHGLGLATAGASAAMVRLLSIVNDDDMPPHLHIQACRAIWDIVLKAPATDELFAFDERLTLLEHPSSAQADGLP